MEIVLLLSHLFTSSSSESPTVSESNLKYWSVCDAARHRPTRKLANAVKRHLSGVTFLKLVANSDQKLTQHWQFAVCVVSSEQQNCESRSKPSIEGGVKRLQVRA